MNDTDELSFSDEELFEFLLKIYRWDEANEEHAVPLSDIAAQLQYADHDALRLAEKLQAMGLLVFVSVRGNISLSSLGMFEVMQALSQPHRPTRFFPPLASFGDVGYAAASATYGNLSGMVSHLRDFCQELALSSDVADRIDSLVDRIDDVISSGLRPDESVVGELQAIDRLLATQPSA
ncbi:hypothetical protein Q4485_02995 [Granulosicoccaceae sp. 1_MG-2023]|nr:hypothetical protein [Granulosicoccaceae sp. 1_MG-2023]